MYKPYPSRYVLDKCELLEITSILSIPQAIDPWHPYTLYYFANL